MLRLLADGNEPIGLARIASALGLAKGTAHGLLRTLLDVGLVEQAFPTGPYRVTPEVFRLGRARLDPADLRSKALNWTDILVSRTGESATVASFVDGRAVVAHHVLDAGRVGRAGQVLLAGTAVPLHASALGKVFLAFDPDAARSIVGRELAGCTLATITDRGALQRDLATIRDRGWATSVEESAAGVAGIAAPIRDGGGQVVATVGIEGDLDRLCDGRSRPRTALVSQVLRAGRSISRELGHGRDS